jgi:hypothetical protein
MRFLVVAIAALSLGSLGVAQKKAEVQVLEAKARRDEGKILVDGRVRVTAEKPLRGLVIVFDLLAPENNVVGSQKAVLDDGAVERGQERDCHSATGEHVRAVRFKIRAFDLGERDLRVANSGPFPIE